MGCILYQGDLCLFPEEIISFARRDCNFCQKIFYNLLEGIESFAKIYSKIFQNGLYLLPKYNVKFYRMDCIFCQKGLYPLPEVIVSFVIMG